ncbi:MAG: hypothetical protein GY941_13410 [Planctomycetes bacterium]|nr:hypothetical protein [Planctomycetota bacterium]
MKKLILLICIAACSLTAASSYASDNQMSREEFKSNCELSGGTYEDGGPHYMSCTWPNGGWIVCYGGSCTTGNIPLETHDNVPQYDPDFDRPQSRYDGSASSEGPTVNEAGIQWSEELAAMERLDKMESIIREKMYGDIFGK